MLFARTHRAMLAALLGSSMLVPAVAFAQEPAEDANDEIIVTAQKREETLQNVPMSIQAIGTEKLGQLQVKEFADYVKFLPSVTIQASGPGFAQVFFRAVASGENANHSTSQPTVGMYLDEQPITTIQGALDIHVYDVARVEALAGPQGTLYGASSMAGTIKIVTNKPDTKGLYGEISGELNTVSHGQMGGTLEGFVNIPVSDMVAVRAVAWHRRDGGYIDNIHGSRTYATSGIEADNSAFVQNNYNDVETYGGRVALGIDLNDSWTITPTLMGQVQKSHGSFAQERGLKYQTVQYNPEGSVDKWYNAGLTIQGKLGNWDMTYAAGYLNRRDRTESDYSDYSYFYDAISGYGAYFYDNNGDYVSPNQYIQAKDRYKKYFQEFRISSPSDNRLRLIAGLFWQRQAHNIEQNYIIDNIADSITVPGTESNIWLTKQQRTDRDQAAFGEVSFDATDKLTFTGGLRVYHYKNSLQGFFGYAEGYSPDKYDEDTGDFIKDGTGVAGCNGRPAIVAGSPCTNVDKTTSDTDFIHKLNATYKFSNKALVYATWSRGFRPGGVNRRGTLPPYRPDQIDNYELGWKTSIGRLRFNGAIYQLDWNDIQLSFLGANGLSEVRNAGVARIRGIEADIGYREGGFTLNAGLSYNKAEIRRDFCKIANASFDCSLAGVDGSENGLLAPAGSRLPVTPRLKGNAVARYEFPVNSWTGHVQLAANHTGSRRSDLRTIENAIKGDLKAYTTLDLSFGLKNENWTTELFATNLLNSGGIINTSVQCREVVCGDPDGVTEKGGVFYDTVIRPRVIGLKLARKF
ncbi:MAG: TonB-dependent receptor [Chakrabartia sp.]